MTTRRPAEVFPPGEYLKDELDARGWTQSDLAEILGRPVRLVNEIVASKRAVTPETAKGLAAAFGTSPELWMNLETAYQLWRTRGDDRGLVTRRARIFSLGPIKEMLRRGWIEPTDNLDVLEARVLNFFEISNLDEDPEFLPHAARKSTAYGHVTAAQQAWMFRAKHLSESEAFQDVRFAEEKLPSITTNLRRLLRTPQDVRHVPNVLAEGGIRLVVVEPLASTRIDGVCFWLNDEAPVIAIALRFDRIDNLWHTLMHEVGHLRNRDNGSLDYDMDRLASLGERPPAEQEADRFAVHELVSQDKLSRFMAREKSRYSKPAIEAFAAEAGIHPGIVVGQLQHRGQVPWTHYRKLLSPIREYITATALTDGWGRALPHSF